MNAKPPIRSIAVAGGGIVGLSAALGFARRLPEVRVDIIETTPDPAALADQLPVAHPSVSHFHARIGIEEHELVRAGIATHHLGTIFDNWSASGESWVHAFGPYGKPAGATPFDQIWVRAKALGRALPYDRYSMGASLARAGKFVHPAKDREFVGSRFTYGLRFDPDGYQAHLRAHAAAAKVQFVSGDIASIERREQGGIAALFLEDGSRIAADLFIDCTGPSARLLSEVDDSFEDWSRWLPFDRIAFESVTLGAAPATAAHVRVDADGWTIDWTPPTRTLTAQLRQSGEGIRIARDRRLRPWVHNVLALGDAATALDPLHGFNLSLAHDAIDLALELVPGRDFLAVETDEYNRRAELLTRRVRDFLALQYLRGPWPEFASTEPPDSLAHTLDQYEYRGRMPFHEDEIVARDSWTAALLNLGAIPHNVDPAAAAAPIEPAMDAMDRLAEEIARLPGTLPTYADYLARIAR